MEVKFVRGKKRPLP
jgi:hypothetical protein